VQQLAAQLTEADTQRKRTVPPHAPQPALKPVSPPAPEPSVIPASEKRLKVRVQLDPRTPLKPARAMMVLTHIKRIGRIAACEPVEADLRSGGFADEFTVTFSTDSEPASVRAALLAIRDVLDVETHLI
jgi:hypothetical protein